MKYLAIFLFLAACGGGQGVKPDPIPPPPPTPPVQTCDAPTSGNLGVCNSAASPVAVTGLYAYIGGLSYSVVVPVPILPGGHEDVDTRYGFPVAILVTWADGYVEWFYDVKPGDGIFAEHL